MSLFILGRYTMQSPDMHFIVNVHNPLTLKEIEQMVVDIGQATPQSLNPLIVCAPSPQSTASTRPSENVHE